MNIRVCMYIYILRAYNVCVYINIYILYSIFYIRYSIFYILYSIFYILYTHRRVSISVEEDRELPRGRPKCMQHTNTQSKADETFTVP